MVAILDSYTWAIVAAGFLGLLLFWLDYRSRHGAGYLFALVGFLSPALLLLAAGLVIPTIQTTVQSFMNSRGTEFVGLENFTWIFTQPAGIRTVLNTVLWVLIAPAVSTDRRAGLRGVHRQVPRREVLQDPGVHADGDLLRRRLDHLALRLHRAPAPTPSRSAC